MRERHKKGRKAKGMKFFHLSDLHIGLRLFNRDLLEDQVHILREIAALAAERQPDAVVIAGDIYDKAVPSAEAVSVFDGFVSALRAAVPDAEIMMISGNHDSAPRVNVFRSVLRRQKIHMIGLPPSEPDDHIEKVVLQDAYGPVCFYLLPFVKPSMVKDIVDTDENGLNLSYDESLRRLLARETIDPAVRNVLVSHQFYLPVGMDPAEADRERTDSEIRTVGNIDLVRADVLAPFDYAALGHIHKPMKVGRETLRYSGTPIACSVSEAGQQKAVFEVELREKGAAEVRILPLTPLREIRRITGPLEEVLTAACSDYVSVVLTDKNDLDVIDMQDRLHYAFPNLLEIRRETLWQPDYVRSAYSPGAALDPCALLSAFLGEPDETETALLRDVINQVLAKQ